MMMVQFKEQSQEVRQICQNIDIPDVNEQYVPKYVVKKAVFDDHYQEMEKEVKKMKKLENIKNDDLRQVHNYFMDKSIEKARMAFKFRSQMLENVPGNFKNKFKKEEEKLKCHHCELDVVMTQSHCLECTAWIDIKKDLNLTKIDDIVQFFQRLLIERAKGEVEEGLKTRPHCTTPATGG